MSNNIEEKSEKDLNEDEIKNINKKNEKNEEKFIDPLSLLTSDLLKEINSIDEHSFEGKKYEKERNINLDDTQKESDENEDDEPGVSEINNESNSDFLNFKIFEKEEKEKNDEIKKGEKRRMRQQNSMCFNNINLHLNLNNNDNSMFVNNPTIYGNNYFQNQNRNRCTNYNNHLNNFTNKLTFFNNSFTMNGKPGWICTHCKNFNYESKQLFFYLYYS